MCKERKNGYLPLHTLLLESKLNMQLSRYSKTSDPLGRYYTSSLVGSLLVKSMRLKCPNTVVDLGAGDGVLVGEAAKVWKNSRFITADIDTNARSAMLPQLDSNKFTHHTTDVLGLTLAEQLGLQNGGADAALCNPPYLRPKWNKHFFEILEDAGLSHILPRMNEVPADLLFIAQNLRLLRNNGRLGLILPDGIISGEKYLSFRKTLIQKHRVERVIELPRRIFRNTDAKAHILVVAKHGKTSELITFQRLDENGILSKQLRLPADYAEKRLDYSYLAQLQHNTDFERKWIGGVAVSVSRGSYSSAEICDVNFPVFHTTDFSTVSEEVPHKFKLSRTQLKACTGTIAVAGDILVARVGRNLSKKVCIVRSGKIAISDCILLLKVVPEHQEDVLTYLQSESGRSTLEAASHGVGAKFLTKQSLLEITF